MVESCETINHPTIHHPLSLNRKEENIRFHGCQTDL